jgi:hypothetical protein
VVSAGQIKDFAFNSSIKSSTECSAVEIAVGLKIWADCCSLLD